VKKAMKVLLSVIGFVGAVSGQREAESGAVIGPAHVVHEAPASGGAILSLPSAGAGAEYASVETVPGPQSVTLKYRSSVHSSLQLHLQPNGGSMSVHLPSTNGEWRMGTFPGITITGTPVNFTLILTGLGVVDVDTWEVCLLNPCGGCGLSVYNESLPPVDGIDPPPVLAVDSPPWPGFVPPPPFTFWGPADNPFIPNPAGSTTSGIVEIGNKWIPNLSFPPSVSFADGGTGMEISNFQWDAMAAGDCAWACLMGCVPANQCELGVSMTLKLHVSPYLWRNNARFIDSHGSMIVTEGGLATLSSGSSRECGQPGKGHVRILMTNGWMETPIVNIGITCDSCVQR
jgi:hypothetical protein